MRIPLLHLDAESKLILSHQFASRGHPTVSGIYIGNAWDHYRCHEIYITDTRHARVCNTVFFKHKYLTMPTITPANALIRAADDLTDALTGVVPPPNMTRDAVDQLMRIFKQQAEKAKEDATTQRVLKKRARDERVHNEESNQPASPSPLPPLEVTYPAIDVGTLRGTPVISQDDDDSIYSTPSANTRFQRQIRTLTQDYLYHMMDTPCITKPFTNRQAAARRYPVAFIRDFASAVLDEETGNLLEYRHLLKHPKYKDIWSKSFGTKIR